MSNDKPTADTVPTPARSSETADFSDLPQTALIEIFRYLTGDPDGDFSIAGYQSVLEFCEARPGTWKAIKEDRNFHQSVRSGVELTAERNLQSEEVPVHEDVFRHQFEVARKIHYYPKRPVVHNNMSGVNKKRRKKGPSRSVPNNP